MAFFYIDNIVILVLLIIILIYILYKKRWCNRQNGVKKENYRSCCFKGCDGCKRKNKSNNTNVIYNPMLNNDNQYCPKTKI